MSGPMETDEPDAVAASNGPSEEGLAALKARVARNKAKREKDQADDAAASPAKTVSFSTVVNERSITYEEHKAEKQANTPVKEKTKAKQRYLKRKLDRKKANKQKGKEEESSVAGQTENKPHEEGLETAEQKKARRKAARAARRQATVAENTDVGSHATQEKEEAEPARKKRKLSIEPLQVEENQPAKSIKAIEKANKALAKAQRRAEKAAREKEADNDSGSDDDAQRNSNVIHLDALPRFARPAKAIAPDQNLLYELSISEELKLGKVVSTEISVKVEDFQESLPDATLRPYLSEKIRKRLAEQDIQELFAVQSTVLPMLLGSHARMRRKLSFPLRDLYVNAPTGSGKTLAYVLPMVQLLDDAPVRRLRAIIVLPTRDLALQVKEVFDYFCVGSTVRVGLAAGHQSFPKEQSALEGDEFGASSVDILIGTPGRILDHLAETTGFTLRFLEYFIIDEADRLLNQSFNDWLPTLLDAISPKQTLNLSNKVQKLLFSATLTRDAAQTNALRLSDPYYVAVRPERETESISAPTIALPPTLAEHYVVVDSGVKPLALAHLLQKHEVKQALCFTQSTQSARRLVNLLDILAQEAGLASIKAVSFSGDLSVAQRTRVLDDFKSGKVSLLVCSDLIARGMDIQQVTHVFNYDCPMDLVKYVHRVGRTARAGRSGEAWTLVEAQEATPFRAMLTKGGHLSAVRKTKLNETHLDPLRDAYERALARLKSDATGQTQDG